MSERTFGTRVAYEIVTKIVKAPMRWFLVSLATMLFMTIVLASASWKNTIPGEYDWIIAETTYSEQADAIGYATAEADAIVTLEEGNITARTNPSDWHTMTHIYQWEDRRAVSILTPANLKTMGETERVLATHEVRRIYG